MSVPDNFLKKYAPIINGLGYEIFASTTIYWNYTSELYSFPPNKPILLATILDGNIEPMRPELFLQIMKCILPEKYANTPVVVKYLNSRFFGYSTIFMKDVMAARDKITEKESLEAAVSVA